MMSIRAAPGCATTSRRLRLGIPWPV